MIRADKIKLVEKLNATFAESPHAILASFSRLEVNTESQLRAKIAAAGGRYSVIKNRLAKRAAAGTGMEHLADRFSGPCALATHADDPVVLAKVLSEFVKDNPQVEVLAGLVDASQVLGADEVKKLATLPGLPELRAQLLALIQTPATTLVRLLATPGTQVARVVDARREALGGGEQE